jgi:hypothetical protein
VDIDNKINNLAKHFRVVVPAFNLNALYWHVRRTWNVVTPNHCVKRPIMRINRNDVVSLSRFVA